MAMTLCGPAYAQAPPAGSVSALTGQVQIQRAGHSMVAVNGTPVETGDTIITGPHSQATISLIDGTQFELAESSTIILLRNQLNAAGQRSQTTLSLLAGLLHSLVHFAPGNAPNYEVHTPNAVAAARGTNYDTDYVKGVVRKDYPGCLEFTDITVFEGTVEVTNPRNPTAGSTKVKPGYKTTVPCGLLLGATAVTTAALSSGAISTGAIVTGAALGTGAIAAGVVVGVGTGGGSGGSSSPSPTVQPTPPITGAQ
ncbi:MAG: FecR domain-containing protein [Candidatus Binataceae bacterium]